MIRHFVVLVVATLIIQPDVLAKPTCGFVYSNRDYTPWFGLPRRPLYDSRLFNKPMTIRCI